MDAGQQDQASGRWPKRMGLVVGGKQHQPSARWPTLSGQWWLAERLRLVIMQAIGRWSKG